MTNSACILCNSKYWDNTLWGGYLFKEKKFNIVRCKKCGFMFIDPLPSQNELDSIYESQEYFDNYFISKNKLASYIQAMEDYSSTDLEILEVIKQYKPSGKILDIGCAAGRFLRNARKYGYKPYGVEPNKPLANYARDQLNLEVLNDNFNKNCFPDEYFDVIYLGDILEHLRNPIEALKIIRKKIYKNSILVINQPLTYNRSLFNTFLHLNMILKRNKHSNYPPTHLWEFTAYSLKKFLTLNHCQIIHWHLFETPPKPLLEEKKGTLKGIMHPIIKKLSAFFSNNRALNRFGMGNRAWIVCRMN